MGFRNEFSELESTSPPSMKSFHFRFHLIFFIHDTPSAKIYMKLNKDKGECTSNHTVLPGGHVSRGLRCLIGPKNPPNKACKYIHQNANLLLSHNCFVS